MIMRGGLLAAAPLLLLPGCGILLSTALQVLPPKSTTTASSLSSRSGSSSPSRAFLLPPLFMAAASAEDDNSISNDDEQEAERMKRKAEELREQIRKMEEQLGDSRKQRQQEQVPPAILGEDSSNEGGAAATLKGKRILVTGANGRLGSMVCRYLLRNFPNTEVVACVHYVGEDSPTARGYARLSYEVGAEDGIGQIGPAWSAEDRTATFEFDVETMPDYNLRNLRIVECELLDPIQCSSVVEGCDSVIWCATDFNGNSPRAVSGLNLALLFRAAANPDKGSVEIEGLENMIGALKQSKQNKKWNYNDTGGGSSSGMPSSNDPIDFVLVSTGTECFENFETPFGEFNAIKRQGEHMLLHDYPSLSSTVIQLARFEDNFVDEGLDIMREEISEKENVVTEDNDEEKKGEQEEVYMKLRRERAVRKINRRDAAKAVVDALTDDDLRGKTVQVWTATRGRL